MSLMENTLIQLSNPNYVPVIKDSVTNYGGNQMWFSGDNKFSKDYVIQNYGCGTIATADFFLYLALQHPNMRSPITEMALEDHKTINYPYYISYVREVDRQYTKTKRVIAVLGPRIASSVNAYAKSHNFNYRATWKLRLTYYDMYEMIKEMLAQDIPVILSIGPNTPKLWGKNGIFFYQKYMIEDPDIDFMNGRNSDRENSKKDERELKYCYMALKQNVNSHYVVVTGVEIDSVYGKVMLRISSWGKSYYINYEEYRDYIETFGGTFTSSILHFKKI
ncbi:MAG: hypothetical protein GX359_00350 [Clostridiales bacterium]|nr:hypothetical protein [Clostridiales bacterium]